jgi:hypothetical protein
MLSVFGGRMLTRLVADLGRFLHFNLRFNLICGLVNFDRGFRVNEK